MGKNLAKVPKLEDFKTPWEEKGEDYDPEKGKSFIHFLMRTKAEAEDKVLDVTKERDTLQTQIDDKTRENESDAEKRQREQAEAAEAKAETLKLRVALRKGLSEIQAKRLVGSTEAELEKDADDLLESFGGNGKPGENEGEGEGQGNEPRTRPQRTFVNPGDPKNGKPEKGFDVDAGVDAYFAGVGF